MSYELEERAAIKEFDGNMTRDEAERQAKKESLPACFSEHCDGKCDDACYHNQLCADCKQARQFHLKGRDACFLNTCLQFVES